MRRLHRAVLLLVAWSALIACALPPATADPVQPSSVRPTQLSVSQLFAADQNRRLSRGINLGNMLEAPAEGEWGLTVRTEYLDLIRAAGFDSVRVPIRWSAHTGAQQPF